MDNHQPVFTSAPSGAPEVWFPVEKEKRGFYYNFIPYGFNGVGFGTCIASDGTDDESYRETYISISFLFWGLIIGVRT